VVLEAHLGIGLMPGHRIVSLIASATEVVCALGFEDCLVGRSHECDFPESVKSLAVCTEPKFNVEGTSYEIDRRVKAILQEGLSVYRVHADKLKELRPSVIVTQSHCEVCAVSLRDVEQAAADWLDEGTRLVSLAPNNLNDVWTGIEEVARVLGVPERGNALTSRLQQRMSAIASRARRLPQLPRVACIEWIDPLMAIGNWMPELVDMAGGINLFGESGKHSPWMTWEQLCQADPDMIVIVPCGFDMDRSRQDIPTLTRKVEWPRLQAVHKHRVYVADGNQFFNRPGPRLVESLEILAEVFHPGVFHFGHKGTGWEHL
jgi:iron complex transport system substrate-binding protein